MLYPGKVFYCTHAANAEKVDHSLEEYVNYIATQLISGRADVKYTMEKEQGFPFTEPADQGAGAPGGAGDT